MEDPMPKTNVKVKLVGEDGNAFAIMGRVRKALKDEGLHELAKEYTQLCTKAESYDHFLRITMDFVETE
jgi:hypothetical protein